MQSVALPREILREIDVREVAVVVGPKLAAEHPLVFHAAEDREDPRRCWRSLAASRHQYVVDTLVPLKRGEPLERKVDLDSAILDPTDWNRIANTIEQ